jgi:hypothetical protein
MKSKYTPIITEESGWWIGRVEGIPSINCRAKSRDELINALLSALTEGVQRDHETLTVISELVRELGKRNKELLNASEAWRRGKGR